jgi:hypothetical protein
VWPRFVSEALVKSPVVRDHSKLARPYATWLDIYDWLGPAIRRASNEMNEGISDDLPYWMKCARNPILCMRKEQMEAWRLDIDRGLRALIEANEALGVAILFNEHRRGMEAYSTWAKVWVPKMFGAHAIGEGAKAMDDFLDWLGEWDPLAPIEKEVIEKALEFLEHEFPKAFEVFDMMEDPETYLSQELGVDGANQVIQDMHMGSTPERWLDWRRFEPL